MVLVLALAGARIGSIAGVTGLGFSSIVNGSSSSGLSSISRTSFLYFSNSSSRAFFSSTEILPSFIALRKAIFILARWSLYCAIASDLVNMSPGGLAAHFSASSNLISAGVSSDSRSIALNSVASSLQAIVKVLMQARRSTGSVFLLSSSRRTDPAFSSKSSLQSFLN